MDERAKRLQAFFREEIPVTRAMGFAVSAWDGETLEVAAPLAKNLNHKRTAFGGSLYSLATLACWGLARLLAEESGVRAHVVIQAGSLEYLRPVKGDFRARCARPEARAAETFARALARKGKARLALRGEIREAGAKGAEGPAAVFQGVFVAGRKGGPRPDGGGAG